MNKNLIWMKRLTLDEYRKVNAIWLSNILFETEEYGACIDSFVTIQYLDYLSVYGVNETIIDNIHNRILDDENETINSQQIEEIISEYETPIEHCHH